MDKQLHSENDLTDVRAVRPLPQTSWIYLSAVILCTGLLIWTTNYVLVQRNVDQASGSDARNSGYRLSAHYRYYIDPSTLILDLRISKAAPLDLLRGLFQSAGALASAGRNFDRVILARSGTPIFIMAGKEFSQLGAEFSGGQNPAFLIRALPEMLYTPSGKPAFGRWEAGMPGALEKQMSDANEASKAWSGAKP